MKIGFIGFGNIAKAMVSGLLKSDESLKDNIYASAAHYDKLIENTKIYGIHAVKSNSELIDIADIIFICSKPYQVKDFMQNQKLEGKIIVSFAASLDFDDLEAIMPHSHHITSIPNTAISCGKGVHIVDKHHSLDEDELKVVTDLLSKTGYVKIMDSSILCDAYLRNFMISTAKKNNIPYQAEIMADGGTDAGKIHITRSGIKTGGISVPTRYIHSPSEMASISDIEACIDLLSAVVNEI